MAVSGEIMGPDIRTICGGQYLISIILFNMNILFSVMKIFIKVAFDLRDRLLF
jgi:hypothetical protein